VAQGAQAPRQRARLRAAGALDERDRRLSALRHPGRLVDGDVAVRAWRDADVPAVAAFGLDADNVRFGAAPPGSREIEAVDYLRAMERMRVDGRGLSFAVVDATSDAVLGGCELRTPAPGVGEVGYLLAPAARGRGVMTRAMRLVVGWAFAELDLARVQAFASPDNAASLALLGRLGFTREGVLRSYRGPGEDRVALSVLPGELRVG
jgi:ribosomal-protein-alanine N-acetyltransferase